MYNIESMVGKVFTKVVATDDTLCFSNENEQYTFLHYQDCCETVSIEDINGDLKDLENLPLLIARESSNHENTEGEDSITWTFYTFATIVGFVDVRWFGSSNGYYSESVNLEYERLQND